MAGVNDIALTLSLPVKGMPEDRLHQVLRNLIGDQERFMAFLRALLGDLDGMVDWAQGHDTSGDAAPESNVEGDETLLEGLVRAASRDPGRLESVCRLIDDLRRTEEGRRVMPDDFLELWSAVEEVLREDRRI